MAAPGRKVSLAKKQSSLPIIDVDKVLANQFIFRGEKLNAFFQDDSKRRGIAGPIGSGKSFVCCAYILKQIINMPAAADGVRRSRFACVRQEATEADGTTKRTFWTACVKPLTDKYPTAVTDIKRPTSMYHFHFMLPDKTIIDAEVFFSGFESSAFHKLYSLELTGGWINEARFVNAGLLPTLYGRTGRYPQIASFAEEKKSPFQWKILGRCNLQDVLDTGSLVYDGKTYYLYETVVNATYREHYILVSSKENTKDFSTFASINFSEQVFLSNDGELKIVDTEYQAEELAKGQFVETIEGAYITPYWHGMLMDTNMMSETNWFYHWAEKVCPDSVDDRYYRQPSGMRPDAENIQNLTGGQQYYIDILANNENNGKKQQGRILVHAEYGNENNDTCVYREEFSRENCVKEIPYRQAPPLYIGMDFGSTPAAVICHVDETGVYVIGELCSDTRICTSMVKFLENLELLIMKLYGNCDTRFIRVIGDPAGKQHNGHMQSVIEIVHDKFEYTRVASTNDVSFRIGSVKKALHQNRLTIAPSCKNLIHGFEGDYSYTTAKAADGEMIVLGDINKNHSSHVHDALQYIVMDTMKIWDGNKKEISNIIHYKPMSALAMARVVQENKKNVANNQYNYNPTNVTWNGHLN